MRIVLLGEPVVQNTSEVDMQINLGGRFATRIVTAVLLIIGVRITNAQHLMQSDTITFTYNGASGNLFALRDFATLSKGQSECHTIYLKNASTDPLVVKQITSYYSSLQDSNWSSNTIITLPTVLLQDEIVSISDFCFVPKQFSRELDSAAIKLDLVVGSNSFSIAAGAHGKVVVGVDSVLLKPCVSYSVDSPFWGPIIIDGDISRTFTIQSNRFDTLLVADLAFWPDSARFFPDNEFFPITGIKFPYKLAPLEKKTFDITFSPRSTSTTVKYRYVGTLPISVFNQWSDSAGVIRYHDQCTHFEFALPGLAIAPTADSVATALSAGSTDVLAMISDNTVSEHTFFFTNTGSTSLKVNGVSLKNAKSFAISNITPTNALPFTLATGESMSVTVAMLSSPKGVYYDELVITAEVAGKLGKDNEPQSISTYNFQLQGLRKNVVASALRNSDSRRLAIYPNPSHGDVMVTFPGIVHARLKVVDLLGNTVATATANERWSWSAHVTAGVYILHLFGMDASGNPFSEIRQLVVTKE